MQKLILLTCCVGLMSVAAYGQPEDDEAPLYPHAPQAHNLDAVAHMKHVAVKKCVANGYDRAKCECVVDTWVDMWSENDRKSFDATGVATPHMRALEDDARDQCTGEEDAPGQQPSNRYRE